MAKASDSDAKVAGCSINVDLLLASFLPPGSVSGGVKLDNMLVSLSKKPTDMVTMISAYLFSPGVILPGIPVCAITTRYNLFVSGICSSKASFFWGTTNE